MKLRGEGCEETPKSGDETAEDCGEADGPTAAERHGQGRHQQGKGGHQGPHKACNWKGIRQRADTKKESDICFLQ